MNHEFSFGEWIRKRRKSLGLTQEAVAKQVGYSIAMIRKIEADERRPTPGAAALLAEALKIPAGQQEAFLKVARQERTVDRLGPVDEEEPFPWRAASYPQNHLPLPATPFIGREVELARLAGLLRDRANRLVVLIGLAGIGKTRLALQAAQGQLDRFPHGVVFVPLAPLDSPEMIVTGIGHAAGFQFYEAVEPEAQLLRSLRDRQMLLVLDSFEHLKEGAGLLPKILQAAPGIQILVTSRERLNLQGEWVFEVQGLTYPSSPEEQGLDRAEAYEAVQLFVQKARQVHPAFSLDEENLECVVRICRLVEGMPLGIELAAAWVRALSCQHIYQEIENSLDFLKAYAHDVPERHHSLRAALDCSWDLLSDEEKGIFRRLSVFRGGFSRQAAQEVTGASLEALASLLDRSLLKRAGKERYDLHELVRQYAASHLQAEPQEYDRTHKRHGSYYALLLERWGEKIASPGQAEALAEMDTEMDNVRQAWTWMVAQGKIAGIQKALQSLWRYHDIRGRFHEGAVLMEQAASMLRSPGESQAAPDSEHPVVLGSVLAKQGYFCVWLGRYEQARDLLRESLALVSSGKDLAALAFTLVVLGYMKSRLGEFPEARQHMEQSLAMTRALGDDNTTIYCLVILSYIHLSQGDYEQAYQLSGEGLVISRDKLGDPLATEHCLLSLAAAASHMGRYTEARRWAGESLQLSKGLNHRSGIGYALKWLGLISRQLGELERAQALLRQSVSQFREVGDGTLMAEALVDLGVVTRASGAEPEAKPYFLEALRAAIDTHTDHTALQALVEIAGIEMQEGNTEQALELVAYCLQHPSARREIKDRAGLLRAELATQLTPEQLEAAEARAQSGSLRLAALTGDLAPMDFSA